MGRELQPMSTEPSATVDGSAFGASRRRKVLLVGAEDEENLALRYIGASLAAAGHSVSIVSCCREQEIPGVLKRAGKERPDVIGLSIAFQCLAPIYFEAVSRLRRSGFRGHIIAGGHFSTFEYAAILGTQPGIDSIGRFEGERTMVHLAAALGNGGDQAGVPNLVFRRQGGIHQNETLTYFPDLGQVPPPLRKRHPDKRLGERFATLITSRGCWHSSCLYCCIGAFHRDKAHRFALRPADGVAAEIADLVHARRVRVLQFHDDNFVLQDKDATLQRLADLRRAMAARGVDPGRVAILIKSRPDVIDGEVAEALRALGCVGVFLGVENASPEGLRSLIRAARPEDIERSFAALRRQEMAVTFKLLAYHPDATVEQVRRNIEFLRRHADAPADVGRAEVVAGSPLERMLQGRNALTGQWPLWDYMLADPAARRLFDLHCRTLGDDSTGYRQLAHTHIALAYHAATVEKLYGSPVARSAGRACTECFSAWNAWLCDYLDRMVELSDTNGDHAPALRAELSQRVAQAWRAAQAAARHLRRHQVYQKIFRVLAGRHASDEARATRNS
jgi:anaerobic magnesium-protoporphyrin IX monomethyl ester cyclase